jgi:transcriptional regulator with XRE-family HTH domain
LIYFVYFDTLSIIIVIKYFCKVHIALTERGVVMIGDRLKELRSNIHKTQSEVAEDLGISRAVYSHFENNRNEPDSEMIVKLSNYYNVSTDYLLGNPVKLSNTKTADIDDDSIIFTYEGRQIPKEDLEFMRRLMRGTRNDLK